MRSLLVFFNWLLSGWQKRFHIKDFLNRNTVFPESSRRILQNINFNMEMTHQGMNLHRISLKRQFPIEWNILETLQLRKSVFLTTRPDTQMSEFRRLAQNLKVLWRSEQRSAIESIRLQEVRTAQQTWAIESTRLQEGPEADAMTANNGSTLCNRLDARVASPDALQWLLKVLVASPDVAYANSSVSRIKISEVYLKRLIGCVILRIP